MGTRVRTFVTLLAVAVLMAACDFNFEASVGGARVYDPDLLAEQIAAGLSEQLGGEFDVVCPPDQPIAADTSFECRATDVAGAVGIIGVRAADNDGNINWELLEVLPADSALAPADDETAGGLPGPAAERPADVPDDWVQFAAADSGYLLWHPPDWVVERSEGTAIFSGPEGTDAYRTTVNVQVVTTTAAGGAYPDADALYADLIAQLVEGGGDVFWEEDDELHMASGSRRALALQAYWERQGEEFMQLAVVMQRDTATLVQISYTAPVELYEDSLDLAITIIESFDVVL